MTVTAAFMTSAASIHAQGFSISIPTGNNIAQVTDPVTGVTYAINKISNTDVRLLTIQPNGSYTTQQIVLPSGYELGGRGARFALDAGGNIYLSATNVASSEFRVVEYSLSDVSLPSVLAASNASALSVTSSGRAPWCSAVAL